MLLRNAVHHVSIITKLDFTIDKENTMKYQNKKTKQIGKVVHYKGITTTLQFDDGKELILTPANLKKYWKEIPDNDVEKITFSELCTRMREYNLKFSEDEAYLYGIIVYKQENFTNHYTEEQRSYRVSNKNRIFQRGKISNSLVGDCIDGSDPDVRLDKYNWSVEFCYIDRESSTCTLS